MFDSPTYYQVSKAFIEPYTDILIDVTQLWIIVTILVLVSIC